MKLIPVVLDALDLAARAEVGDDEVAAARRRGERAGALSGDDQCIVIVAYIAELLGTVSLRSSSRAPAIGPFVASLAAAAGAELSRVLWPAVALALRDDAIASSSPAVAAAAHVALLEAFPIEGAVTIWAVDEAGSLVRLAGVSGNQPEALALRLVRGEENGENDGVDGAAIRSGDRPIGAVVIRSNRADGIALAAATESADALRGTFEVARLRSRNEARERTIVGEAERRIVRIGYDLHDGPLQDIALLRGDVRLLRRQVATSLSGDLGVILAGRVDDLDARVAALDTELRNFSLSFETPTLLRRPFGELLTKDVEAFGARSGLDVSTRLEGELDSMTASRRIAIFRIIQEALANVRNHSGATRAEIEVVERGGSVQASVADNGNGFDVEATLTHALRQGRAGLIGMQERTRLLGGTLTIDSRPGGPTRVSLTLPSWN